MSKQYMRLVPSITKLLDDNSHKNRVPESENEELPNLYQRLRLATFRPNSPKWKRSTSYTTTYTNILRNLVVYSLAAWGLVSIATRVVRPHLHEVAFQPEQPRGCACGNSISEAISLGCKFDSLSMAWLPEHCRDEELTAEFETAGDGPNGTWLYYADTEHTRLLDAQTVAAMGNDPSARVHMGTAWHRVHCVFYWRKAYRTRFTGKIVEPRSDSEGHIKHCGKVFEDPGYGTISGVSLNADEE
jgi:hypothetical protein